MSHTVKKRIQNQDTKNICDYETRLKGKFKA